MSVRFALISDTHLEFPGARLPDLPDPDLYDAVILAGDIGYATDGVVRVAELVPDDKQVFFLPGNHEYYRQPSVVAVDASLAKLRLGNDKIEVLNPGAFVFNDVLLVGATLWSDLVLDGSGVKDQFAYERWIERNISDFHVITQDPTRYPRSQFSAGDCKERHAADVRFIEVAAKMGPTHLPLVVVTHFMPCQQFIAPKYHGDGLNPYFCNDLDHLIVELEPMVWVCGHTHSAYDGVHPAGTRLICNPLGYPGENADVSWKIFEV